MFLTLDRLDSNFDRLGRRLERVIGPSAPLTEFVKANVDSVRHLIDLRNFHEHPGTLRTVIENFSLSPDERIQVPTWHVSNEPPNPIREEMLASIEFFIQLAESMLIHLVLLRLSKKFPYIIMEGRTGDIDPNVPIKYRLSIDLNKVRIT